jgi:hypothetical protein
MKVVRLGLDDIVPHVLMLEIEDCDFKEDGTVEEEVYHDDMFNSDLHFYTSPQMDIPI